jgi:hypothetical protein
LPFPTTNIRYAHVIQRYHKHLHDGTKSDAVTGWLLYASFYYVLKTLYQKTSSLTHESCNTASLLNNVLTVKASRSPFRSFSNTFINGQHIRYAHVIQRCHKHLNDGTKSDAVTGWLLYASFFYALGQYNTTLKIIDHVLSRCTPDMIMIGKANYTTNDIKHTATTRLQHLTLYRNVSVYDKVGLHVHNVY